MRNVLIGMLAALVSIGTAWGEPIDGLASGFVKADFKKEMPVPKLAKLVGSGGGNLFVSRAEGGLDALDKSGIVVMTFPAKEGDVILLKQPEAVAIEGDNLYVVDSETDQVVMYSVTTGKYLGRFGAKAGGFFGKDENVLKSPRGLAVQGGVVYVVDSGNDRIQLFGVNGVFLHTLPLHTTQTGDAAKATPFKLKGASEIVLDGAGRIYVLNGGDKQIKAYSPEGQYLMSLPYVGNAVSLAIAEDGIYVADGQTSVVTKFDLDGKLAYTFGSKGDGKSQFKRISGLVAEKGQFVYIGDADKALVNEFVTQAGTKQDESLRQAGRTSMKWLASLPYEASQLAGGNGVIYAISQDRKSLTRFRNGLADGEIKPEEMEISAAAVDASGSVWVTDNKAKRVVKLEADGKISNSFGSVGVGAGQFTNPSAIAVASSGLVFVADAGNRNIQVFRSDGVYLNNLNGNAAAMTNPAAMGFDFQGNLYILDKGMGSISVYSGNGNFLYEFGKQGAEGLFAKASDMVITADEVQILEGNQVKTYTLKGELLRMFGSKETGMGNLQEPVAVGWAGGSSLFVADPVGKRIQSFAVLHKLQQPEQFVAEGYEHAIMLNWAKPAVSHAKEYRVFRSKMEAEGFVQYASTIENSFIDAGLDADAKYFYKIAAVTDYGFEGVPSPVVSAISEKFVPEALTAIKVETTPWQVKLSWEPAAADFFAGYRIYQKEGENFVKVAEVTQPAFSKDALTPESKYTYYVAVASTDGTESEKLAVEATTLVFNRPPLDIEVIKLSDIFSNSYKLYEKDGIGQIKLTNNTDKPMDKVKVSFVLKNFMDYPTEMKIDKLMPGQSADMVLKAVFNNSILTVTEDSSVQAMIEASYFEAGKKVTYNRNEAVNIYDKHRLSWGERDRFASFVTPKDPPILNLVRSVVGEYAETKDEIQLAAAFFNAIGLHGLTYIQDPSNPYQVSSGKTNTVDYIQFPRETLERKSGDCDDLVAFYSSGLESMGINTRILEVPGHMLMMFSTGIPADPDGYTMDNLYVIYEDMMWIPVETTLVGNSFVKAWESGSSTYYKFVGKGLTVLDIHGAWETYKPASLPDSEWKPSGLKRDAIEKKFPSDHMSVLKISSQTKTRRYLERLQNNPADVDALLQMGIILAKIGDRPEAMKYFDKVLTLDNKNASAMNNRGNLLMIDDKYADAQKAYLAASVASPKDAQVLVNLARAYKRTGNTKGAKAAFIKAQKIDPKVKEQYRALALELLNAL